MGAYLVAAAAFFAGAGLAWRVSAGRHYSASRKEIRRQWALIGGAAQQLRTPLNDVLGLVQTLALRAEEFPQENKELIETVAGSGAVAKAVLLDVFDILDVESGRMRLRPRIELLPDVIEFARRTCSHCAKDKGVALSFDMKASARAWLLFDDMRVRQCASAMVRQAIVQSASAVKVEVEVIGYPKHPKERRIVVRVSDDGPGMHQENAESYFSARRFSRNQFLMSGGASPLSLVVSRMLARKMGGELSAASAPGDGVIFKLEIPAKFVRQAQEDSCASDLTPFDIATRLVRDRSLLIAEDNEVNAQVLAAFLRRLQPKKIVVARNGAEALVALGKETYGLVLMDTQMPVMDGLTAVKKIRESGANWRAVPIIAVSAAAHGDDREACFKAGVDAFIAKPISADTLYEKIGRVCSD